MLFFILIVEDCKHDCHHDDEKHEQWHDKAAECPHAQEGHSETQDIGEYFYWSKHKIN